MNDAHRHRHDADRPGVELLDQRGGVGDHLLDAEAVGVLGGADAAVVERDRAVAGRQERRDLVQVPGAARAAPAGDEQHRIAGAAVVVGQIHPAEATRPAGRPPLVVLLEHRLVIVGAKTSTRSSI